jgi:hypothetical protein
MHNCTIQLIIHAVIMKLVQLCALFVAIYVAAILLAAALGGPRWTNRADMYSKDAQKYARVEPNFEKTEIEKSWKTVEDSMRGMLVIKGMGD